MKPISISRTEHESCLVEGSVNSVRVSFLIKKGDPTKPGESVEILLSHMYQRFFALRADKFKIFRKVPVDGYDFTFLITDDHLEKYKKEELVNFVLQFIQGIEKEIMDLKLDINKQCNTAAKYFATMLANNPDPCPPVTDEQSNVKKK